MMHFHSVNVIALALVLPLVLSSAMFVNGMSMCFPGVPFFLNDGLCVETNQISVSPGSLSMSYYLSLWLPVQHPLRLEVTDGQLL